MSERPPLPSGMSITGDERTTLVEMLDYYRTVFLRKCSGLTDEQLDTAIAPSSLTLGGLLFHLTLVEDSWFEYQFLGLEPREPFASFPWEDDADYELTHAHEWPGAERIAMFEAAVARSKQIIADHSLDQRSVRQRESTGEPWNLRWIVVHMIEEYARHCGHADFLRESIDGVVDD